MNDNFSLEELEAYLYGELSPDKRKKMEEEIKIDLSLQKELAALQISREAVEMAAWKNNIAEAQEAYLAERKEIKLSPTVPSGMSVWMRRIAASFALIMVGGLATLYFGTSPESITDNQIDYSIPVLRSGADQLAELEKAFQSEDFSQVIVLSQGIAEYEPKTSLLVGLAYLEENKGKQAEEYLNKIEAENLKSGAGDFADQVDYYLVKSYLMQGKYSEAELRIQKILADDDHTYHDNFGQLDLIRIQILKMKN